MNRSRGAVMQIGTILLASMMVWSAMAQASADDASKVTHDVIERYIRAYDSHDPSAIAKLFVPDGVFLPPNGAPIAQGQEALEKAFSGVIKNIGGHETINVIRIVPAGVDAVVAVTEFRIEGSGETVGKVLNGRAAITLTKTAEGWKYVSIAPQATSPQK
jgi:uncharacterized protein (TIGR02246 family)